MTRPVTAADRMLERHPWLAYVVIALMAFFMSLEGVSF